MEDARPERAGQRTGRSGIRASGACTGGSVPRTAEGQKPLVIALAAAILGGLLGGGVVAVFTRDHNRTTTTVSSFDRNSSVIAKPQDIQGILAKVEPGVVSVRTQGFQQGGFFPVSRAGPA